MMCTSAPPNATISSPGSRPAAAAGAAGCPSQSSPDAVEVTEAGTHSESWATVVETAIVP
jgi:hypothetical protein